MTARRKPAPDQADRDRAARARGANVLADAGAGTGKTTLLVARIVELVAPEGDAPPVPLPRLAAITFTRKAAGELKLRVREAFLRALSAPALGERRRALLLTALSDLDTAHVGTIHAFADRLLRLSPVESRLSPSYEIAEDAAPLLAEAFDLVVHAVEAGTLHEALAGLDRAAADEASAALVDALRAGLRAQSREHAHGEVRGLDRLFARLVETRDVPPAAGGAPPRPDLAAFRERARAFREEAARVAAAGTPGARYLRWIGARLGGLLGSGDPAAVLAELNRIAAAKPAKLRRRDEFDGDAAAWRLWKRWSEGDDEEPALREALAAPFRRWLAARLVRCAPAFVAAYDLVKARRGAVDQVDLLLALRDLLRARKDVRARYQALLDHVLVDEFQDTDPLQAEIVLFLCEDGARADAWSDVALVPGKLTIVGDPKQSIYRFRRADVAMYAAVRALVGRGGPVTARLSANFRSAPALVAWLNDRFDRLLGTAPAGEPGFDPHAGTVANEPLVAGREADGEDRAPRALLLPLAGPEDGGVDELRAVEGPAIAAFLRALVERGERRVVDPATGERRPVRYGDVAVLCAATTQLGFLLPALDRMGVPFAARGSTLFLDDPLHRQLLLALRALSDRDDGVAEAAILRPPFFAVDVADLAAARAAPEGSTDPGVVRARAARAKLAELRRRRLDGPPGAAARALVEETALARAVALGPNAAQRLDGLRELCLQLERLAAEEGLDLDAATGRLRAWAVEPVQLDPPRPVGRDAVQVLSTHQAKGLEFPVVVLWDACARLASPTGAPAFAIDRDGAAWAVKIDGLEWSEPPGSALAAREKAFLDAERRRLVYVAATRARDWLVVPFAGPDGRSIHGALGDGAPPGLVEVLEPYGPGAEAPAWAAGVAPPAPPAPGDAGPLAARVEAAWGAARADAGAPRLAPTSVTAEAHREDAAGAGAEEEGVAGARPRRESRFGPVFGDTVHRAIGLALARPALSPAEAVAAAARATGLPERRDEAEEDVARALAGLEREGLRRPPGPDLRLEYPVALGEGERLVQGYVDLLGTAGGRLAVVDFKTDAPPAGDVRETHAAYVAQVRAYARIVAALGLAAPGEVRAGLLFTADGEVRWVA